ncbi:MAG: PAS domain S-box protein [Anaerolineae bacterium]|nr:PAS domain S-box protein [Anaerolineae bacterium]
MQTQFINLYRNIQKIWYQWIEPPHAVHDPGIYSRSRFLSATVLLLIPLVLFLSLIGVLLSGGQEAEIFNDLYSHLLGLGTLIVIYALNRRGWYRPAAALLIGISVFIVFWGAMPYDDPADADFLVYLAIPVLMTYLLLSSRAAFLVALSCLIGMLALPLFVPSLNFLAILYFQGTFLIVVLLLSWLVNRHRVYEERTRQAILRESEKSLRLITDNMHEIIFYFNAQGKLQYLSPSIKSVLGYENTIASKSWHFWMEIIHPDDLQMAMENIQRAVEGTTPIHYKYRVRHHDGHFVWLETASAPLKDEGGIVFTCRDVTQRKMVQDQLYAAERERRLLAESMRDTVVALNSSLKLEEVLSHVLQQAKIIIPHEAGWIGLLDSGAVYAVGAHGYTERGMADEQSLHYSLDTLVNLRRIIDTNQPVIIENTEQNKNWEVVPEIEWVKSSIGAPISVGNQVVGIISLDSGTPYAFTEQDAKPLQALAQQASTAVRNAMLYETVEQHAYELEQHVVERTIKLNRAKQRAETILAHNTDAILLLRDDGTISQVNPAFNTLFGYDVDEFIDENMVRLIPAESRPALENALLKLKAGEPTQRLELVVQRKDFSTFWADAALTVIPDIDVGHMVVCSLRDITPLKQVEDGLRRALEKERELNELKSMFVTTVSHEFRTPLAIIQSSSDLLKHYGERLTDVRKDQHLETIQNQVVHMTDMLQQILTYNQEETEVME